MYGAQRDVVPLGGTRAGATASHCGEETPTTLWHAAAVALAGLLTGCDAINGTGCSDVGWQSNMIIGLGRG